MIEDAVSFDPVIIGRDDLENVKQSSSVGHGNHEMKTSPLYSPYSPPPSQYGGPPPAGYAPHTTTQFYVPPARYGSPPLPPLPTQQQQYPQRHMSYVSAMSSAEDANYSRPTSGEMRAPAVPEDIRRLYGTN